MESFDRLGRRLAFVSNELFGDRMIEVYFPSLHTGEGIDLFSKREMSVTVSSEGNPRGAESPQMNGPLRENVENLSPFRRISPGADVIKVSEYLECLRKETALRLMSPQWSNFEPNRVSLRLHEEWADHVREAESIGDSLCRFIAGKARSEKGKAGAAAKQLRTEIVLPNHYSKEISTDSHLLSTSLLTLSDLFSNAPMEDWKSSHQMCVPLREHPFLGLEFQARGPSADRELFRQQVAAASFFRPKFIRIVQLSSVIEGLFCNSSTYNVKRTELLARLLDALGALGYEPVALYPRAIIFAVKTAVDLSDLGVPKMIFGVGVGARSQRTDFSSRIVTSKNLNHYLPYRESIQSRWQERETVKKAAFVPYLHEAIEKELVEGRGISYDSLHDRYGINLEEVHPGLSEVLKEEGLLKEDANRLQLTPEAEGKVEDVIRNFFVSEQDIKRIA